MEKNKKISVLGLPVSDLGFVDTIKFIEATAISRRGSRVFCCTLNEVVMFNENKKLREILKKAEINTADGMPLVWALKIKGSKRVERVYGPEILKEIKNKKIKQIFIGNELNKKYFQKIGDYLVFNFNSKLEEDSYKTMVEEIKKSKARIVWVALGSKRQIEVANELFLRLPNRVYITVGAAFDFVSGNKKQAPKWMRNSGMEWCFRLFQEPGRLFGRYIKIVLFILGRGRKFQF